MIIDWQIALFNTDLSIQNFEAAMAVPAALGLDPTIANSGGTSKHKFSTFIIIRGFWFVHESVIHYSFVGCLFPLIGGF